MTSGGTILADHSWHLF